MVKGVTRRVVVVKSPDPRLFEQAIFIMRDDIRKGVSADDILKEACGVADAYMRRAGRKKSLLSALPAPLFAAAGAGVTALFGSFRW